VSQGLWIAIAVVAILVIIALVVGSVLYRRRQVSLRPSLRPGTDAEIGTVATETKTVEIEAPTKVDRSGGYTAKSGISFTQSSAPATIERPMPPRRVPTPQPTVEPDYGIRDEDLDVGLGSVEYADAGAVDYLETGTVEQDYFSRTRLFPPMHVVGIRKALVEAHPWLPVSVYKAFIEAKALAIAELQQIGHFAATLPWGVAELEATQKLMGEDYWSYGVAPNQHALDTFVRYHHEQGISPRLVKPEELFVASVLDMARN